ncbi:MAG: TrkH family potassium uptake protein [Deltaproteobacteria bacterium]|nr:TrkH family potassium uptake protein [Deltaproteobacteria bacterium]MBW2445765.1 TrkH family potassium uptake protein [Deltaproteobacteria bacterium]
MNALLDLRILGWLIVGIGVFEWFPLAAAALFGERLYPLAASSTACLVVGFSIVASVRPTDPALRNRDGFLVVSVGWALAATFGALPYLLWDVLGPIDALFEATAGFTTTGSTVLADVENVPRSLMIWRSLTQWLGGMGIIVFALAILPALGIGGMQLFKAEIPGPTADKLRPRIVSTARRLLFVYVGFTVAEFVALEFAGLSFYDALCHSLTTVSTGGFSTRNASIASFGSATVEWIVIGFMLLGGINFALHYRWLRGDFGTVYRDPELRYFLTVVAVATGVVTWLLTHSGHEAGQEVRASLFQVVSIVTTTGYATADFEAWPPLASVILLQLMVLGGMAGSTSGGVKDVRVILSFSVLRNALDRGLHPRSIGSLKYAGQIVPTNVLAGIWAFLTAYVGIALLATAILAGTGYELDAAVSAALTAIGNVGPALGPLGPTETFADMPAHGKLTLAFCMIAGRLEIYTLIMLFVPGFWRR